MSKACSILAGLCVLCGVPGFVAGVWAAAPAAPELDLSAADRAAVFKAAGARLHKGKWIICAPPADAGAPEPDGAVIDMVRDLNGDGRPEVVVSDGGSYCYGYAGVGFQLLSKQSDGGWRVITNDTGMPTFLKTKGVDGWPDISVGGPGFCFPVQRWNGKAYTLNRHEYEGKRCKPQR
jgi:hypothetical protein